jgi:NADH-quinone oxidoreductase subunit N
MTLLYGNLGAIPQQNVKRLLAYSSIGHAGYLLVGIAAGSRLGGEAFLFYLIAYAVTNLAAFLAVVASSRALGSDDLSAYRGLSERSPFLAATLFIALLSLAGVPPLAGFFGKFLILTSAVQSNLFWLAIWGAINIVISLYYYLMVIKRMYIDRATDQNPISLSLPVRISLALTVLGIVGIGSFQGPFLELASSAASQLF